MKYLLKFHESVSELTKADIDKIEDLFLDWESEIIPKFAGDDQNLTKLQKIQHNWDNLGFFDIYISLIHPNGVLIPGPGLLVGTGEENSSKNILQWYVAKEYLEEIGFDRTQRPPWWRLNWDDYTSTQLNNPSDVDKLFINDKNHRFFEFLDKHYDIKESLKSIMGRTRGIKHYGFDHSIRFEFRPLVYHPDGGLYITFFVIIKIMKPKRV